MASRADSHYLVRLQIKLTGTDERVIGLCKRRSRTTSAHAEHVSRRCHLSCALRQWSKWNTAEEAHVFVRQNSVGYLAPED